MAVHNLIGVESQRMRTPDPTNRQDVPIAAFNLIFFERRNCRKSSAIQSSEPKGALIQF